MFRLVKTKENIILPDNRTIQFCLTSTHSNINCLHLSNHIYIWYLNSVLLNNGKNEHHSGYYGENGGGLSRNFGKTVMIYQICEAIFQTCEAIFPTCEAIFRTCEAIFRTRELYFGLGEAYSEPAKPYSRFTLPNFISAKAYFRSAKPYSDLREAHFKSAKHTLLLTSG